MKAFSSRPRPEFNFAIEGNREKLVESMGFGWGVYQHRSRTTGEILCDKEQLPLYNRKAGKNSDSLGNGSLMNKTQSD